MLAAYLEVCELNRLSNATELDYFVRICIWKGVFAEILDIVEQLISMALIDFVVQTI